MRKQPKDLRQHVLEPSAYPDPPQQLSTLRVAIGMLYEVDFLREVF